MVKCTIRYIKTFFVGLLTTLNQSLRLSSVAIIQLLGLNVGSKVHTLFDINLHSPSQEKRLSLAKRRIKH
jgi:hypothetical protein